jgi:hypothetical protein
MFLEDPTGTGIFGAKLVMVVAVSSKRRMLMG